MYFELSGHLQLRVMLVLNIFHCELKPLSHFIYNPIVKKANSRLNTSVKHLSTGTSGVLREKVSRNHLYHKFGQLPTGIFRERMF